jgi:uncharacterized circularly permuted ATP-grasp superfamily protein/uncharacterized alpha-E superfamily protein
MTASRADVARHSGIAALTAHAASLPRIAGHFDEWREADGTPRPHWRRFASHAGDLGEDALAQASRRVARQIEENGVTYTVYGDDNAGRRPWALDALPMLVTSTEWDALEPGLRQYGRLLEATAGDLYGDRRLLSEGVVPPALVLPHPGFLRACQGVRPPGGVLAHTLALDLARSVDGRWQVVGIRAQAPSGLGYALENRATVARLFPDALRDLRTRALTPFYDALQDVLLASAPCETGAPGLVLLTPGPFSETYFEHAFLAKQLGVPLVEGGDLTVRHDRVFLKTVSGLEPVHAVWRRLDDDYSDPLELRSDSTLGVPGLVHAWRAGHVLVANAFGLSVLESPALLAFLPAIAERILGAPLALSPVPTTWRAAVDGTAPRADLANLVIKPVFPSTGAEPVFGHALTAAERGDWRVRLAADPSPYALQDYVPLSQVPAVSGGALEGRGVLWRVFLVTDGRGDYRALPGGLSRITGGDQDVVSGHRGGGSKDTWVLSTASADVPAARPIDSHRATSGERSTPSRVAEHLFWFGRYAERSENVARLLRAVLSRVNDAEALPPPLLPAILRTCLSQGLLGVDGGVAATADDADGSTAGIESALITGLNNATTHHSLGFNVAQLGRAAGSVRDRLSSDAWRVLQGLFDRLVGQDLAAAELDDVLDTLDDAILALVAIGGLEMAHMTRDDGWRFLSLGRHLERLAFVSATLDDVETERVTGAPAILEWLLDLSDSLITYRARHLRRPEWPAVMGLLFYDERNPRSAMFQVGKIGKHVRLLPDPDFIAVLAEIDRLQSAGRRRGHGQGDLFSEDTADARDPMPRACRRLAARVSDALTLRYFSHVYEPPPATVTV